MAFTEKCCRCPSQPRFHSVSLFLSLSLSLRTPRSLSHFVSSCFNNSHLLVTVSFPDYFIGWFLPVARASLRDISFFPLLAVLLFSSYDLIDDFVPLFLSFYPSFIFSYHLSKKFQFLLCSLFFF